MTAVSATADAPRALRGPHAFAAFRFLASGSLDGAPEFFAATARRYGSIARFRAAGRIMYAVTEPDLVRDVLVTKAKSFRKSRGIERMRSVLGDGLLTSEQPLHLRQRRLVQPAFHRERIAGYAETMAAYARRTADGWRAGDTLDMADAMMRLTLGIAAKTLFDADLSADATDIGQSLATVMSYFPRSLAPFGELLEALPLPATRRFKRARARLDEVIFAMIAARRRDGRDRGDVLSMLLASRDDDGTQMDDRQVRDEVLTILLAGNETTAVALTWAWYLLSEHPPAAARLRDELRDTLGDRDPEFADAGRLPFAMAIIKEAMRLYPPAWVVGRRAVEDVTLGDVLVKRDETILMPAYAAHRDPRWFEEPLAFRPERWLVERELPRFAYFPFGGGNRLCIGESFAWLEAVLVLATVARRFSPRLVPGTPVATAASVTLRPKHPMWMVL